MRRAYEAETKPIRGRSRTGVALLSGCADDEYSYDAWFNERANGAFTRVALDTLHASTSLSDWHGRIRSALPGDRYPQTPQLSAAWTQRRRAPLD